MYGETGVPGIQSGLASNQPQVERNPAMQEAFLSHEARIQDLDSVINRLESRLSVAMRPVGPTTQSSPAPKEVEHPVMLVAMVNRSARSLEFQVGRLHEILNRLEI